MLTDDDAAEARSAVADYLACDEGAVQIVEGNPYYRLVLLGRMQEGAQYDPYSYVYSLDSKKVYPVRSELDPVDAFEVIANRDNS